MTDVIESKMTWTGDWKAVVAWLDGLSPTGRWVIPVGSCPPVMRIRTQEEFDGDGRNGPGSLLHVCLTETCAAVPLGESVTWRQGVGFGVDWTRPGVHRV